MLAYHASTYSQSGCHPTIIANRIETQQLNLPRHNSKLIRQQPTTRRCVRSIREVFRYSGLRCGEIHSQPSRDRTTDKKAQSVHPGNGQTNTLSPPKTTGFILHSVVLNDNTTLSSTMEDAKLQALHDTLCRLSGKAGRGLGASSLPYSWSQKNASTESSHHRGDGLPNNALYANFVKEGTYNPNKACDDGDGRVIIRDFSDIVVASDQQSSTKKEKKKSKEERKMEKKATRKAAKLEAKQLAKLEEKKRLKKEEKLAATLPSESSKKSGKALKLESDDNEPKDALKSNEKKQKSKSKRNEAVETKSDCATSKSSKSDTQVKGADNNKLTLKRKKSKDTPSSDETTKEEVSKTLNDPKDKKKKRKKQKVAADDEAAPLESLGTIKSPDLAQSDDEEEQKVPKSKRKQQNPPEQTSPPKSQSKKQKISTATSETKSKKKRDAGDAAQAKEPKKRRKQL